MTPRENGAVGDSNLELARGAVGDMQKLFDLFDKKLVWDNTALGQGELFAQGGIAHGKAAAVRLIRSWVGTWTDFRFEALETFEAGDCVVLHVRQGGLGRGSGVPMQQEHWQVWTFHDQRIVRASMYATREDAMRALGAGATEPTRSVG